MSESSDQRLADALEASASRDLCAAAPPDLGVSAAQIAGATLVLAPKIPATYFNRVIGLGLERPATEADVDVIAAAYLGAGVTSFWIHLASSAQPAQLAAWLRSRGFVEPRRRSWAKFLRDTRAAPSAQTRFTVRRATAADAPAVGAVVCSAYGLPATLAPWFAALVDRPRWQVFVALDGTRVVGTGSLFLEARGGWLGVAATLCEFREHGAQSALLTARIAAAAAAGCAVLTTETGEPVAGEPNPSYDNIRRSGFIAVGSRLNLASPET